MEGLENRGQGAAASDNHSNGAEAVDHAESDFLLLKSVSEIACRLTPEERAVLDNVRRRIDGTMGPNFFESIDHSFLYPATEKTDGLTALDRELLGETTSSHDLNPSGASGSANTTDRAAVALQQLSIDRKDRFDFLGLPREIRDQIYDLCLVADFEIVMYPEEYEIHDVPSFWTEDQPCVALLQLNKQGYSETFPVFYGKNVFRMPTNTRYNRTFRKYSRYIHYISIHLDYREVTEQEKQAIAIAEHMAPDTDFALARPDAARWRHIHKRHLDLMISKWQRRRNFITNQMTALEEIELDLSWYYCPGLCCRKAIIYSDLFHQFVKGSQVWFPNGGRIEVRGLATDLERNILSTPRWQNYAKLP